MLKIFLFALLLAAANANMNKVMDEILQLANFEIRRNNLSTIAIPDTKLGFDDRIGFIHLGLGLDLKKGWMRDLSTLKRMGDVTFPLGNDSTILVDAVIGLGDLVVHFDEAVVDMVLFKITQNVSVTVRNNAVSFQLALVANGDHCNAQANRLTITEFSHLDITFYPKSILHRLKDAVASAMADLAAPVLRYFINPKLGPIFNGIFEKVNVCKLIPIPEISKNLNT